MTKASSLCGMRPGLFLSINLCVATALLAGPGVASGCPVCDTEEAREVRAALADGDGLLVNVMAAALPSLAFAGVVAAAYFAWPTTRERRP